MSAKSSFAAKLMCLTTLTAVFGLAATAEAADAYADQLRSQLNKIAPTEEQAEPFRAVLADYFSSRNDVLERTRKKTHMNQVPCEPKKACDRALAERIGRELGREAVQSVEAMSAVLTPEQLVHYEKFVEVGNRDILARAGLQ